MKGYILKEDGEKKLIKNLASKKADLKKFIDDQEKFDLRQFHKNIWGDKKYPSVENIKTLYYRLGIDNIFNNINSKGHKSYQLLLKSFTDKREAIAHQGAISLTYNDAVEQIKSIQEFVRMLDKELCSLCCRLAGSNFWPSV